MAAIDDFAEIAARLKTLQAEREKDRGKVEAARAIDPGSAPSVDELLGGYDPTPLESYFDVMF